MTKAEFQREIKIAQWEGWNRGIRAAITLAGREGASGAEGKLKTLLKQHPCKPKAKYRLSGDVAAGLRRSG
jgi:hypothetical protein